MPLGCRVGAVRCAQHDRRSLTLPDVPVLPVGSRNAVEKEAAAKVGFKPRGASPNGREPWPPGGDADYALSVADESAIENAQTSVETSREMPNAQM